MPSASSLSQSVALAACGDPEPAGSGAADTSAATVPTVPVTTAPDRGCHHGCAARRVRPPTGARSRSRSRPTPRTYGTPPATETELVTSEMLRREFDTYDLVDSEIVRVPGVHRAIWGPTTTRPRPASTARPRHGAPTTTPRPGSRSHRRARRRRNAPASSPMIARRGTTGSCDASRGASRPVDRRDAHGDLEGDADAVDHRRGPLEPGTPRPVRRAPPCSNGDDARTATRLADVPDRCEDPRRSPARRTSR